MCMRPAPVLSNGKLPLFKTGAGKGQKIKTYNYNYE